MRECKTMDILMDQNLNLLSDQELLEDNGDIEDYLGSVKE